MVFIVKVIDGVKKIIPVTADTGTGAPIGSIIVVCSNILPSGYLGLGVQYDITNYPALYQVLGTDTTPTASALGLPTLSSGQYAIKATSGLTENQQENVLNTINENNSYSTEEHPTGKKWIDGKPIYRRVFSFTGVSSTQRADTILMSNFPIGRKQIIKLEGYAYRVSNNGAIVPILCLNVNSLVMEQDFATDTYDVTVIVEYTKTTDN